jgi:hypothetical protein
MAVSLWVRSQLVIGLDKGILGGGYIRTYQLEVLLQMILTLTLFSGVRGPKGFLFPRLPRVYFQCSRADHKGNVCQVFVRLTCCNEGKR